MKLAIVVVAYNRADTVKNLIKSLTYAHYKQNVDLIISIDKSETDIVAEFAETVIWSHGTKRIVKHSQNLGLRKHILSIGDYTKIYDAVIVLEDDLIVSPCFFDYAIECVEKYKDDERVAGISLYGFPFNNYMNLPFIPQKDEYDAYFMQIAQSWGQVWMKKQWSTFAQWYKNNNEEFDVLPHLPSNICHWGKKSWLKYHNKYCIEQGKYFVYPFVSLSSNSGSAGTHSKVATNVTRTMLQGGMKTTFALPDFDQAIKYDGFYERENLGSLIGYSDICIDLYGLKQNLMGNRYWLTTKNAPYKAICSFGLELYPIEENVIQSIPGESIYLYDTSTDASLSKNNNTFDIISYFFKVRGIYTLMKREGFMNLIFKVIRVVVKREL